MSMLSLQILLKTALKEMLNPQGTSQTHPMHATSQPRADAIPSSIPSGKMAEPMARVPAQIMTKNLGWLACTVRSFLLSQTHNIKAKEKTTTTIPNAQQICGVFPNSYNRFTKVLVCIQWLKLHDPLLSCIVHPQDVPIPVPIPMAQGWPTHDQRQSYVLACHYMSIS
jgi:hypothetical protein